MARGDPAGGARAEALRVRPEAAGPDRTGPSGRGSIPALRLRPGRDDRRSAAHHLPADVGEQAVLLPRHRPDRRRVHAGLSDGGRRRARTATTPISGRSGSPTAASTASTSGRRTGPGPRREDEGDHPGAGAAGRSSRGPSWPGSGRATTGSARTAGRSARIGAPSRSTAPRRVRIIDFDIAIKATAGPLTFGDTKEGMFGLRVASSMDVKRKKGGQDHQRRGSDRRRGLGQGLALGRLRRARRRTDGRGSPSSTTPSSFRFPTTWHVRDYGLFAANPFGWQDFGRKERGDHTVPAGESIRFGYRVILHEGDTASLGRRRGVPGVCPAAELEVAAD